MISDMKLFDFTKENSDNPLELMDMTRKKD